MLSASSKARGRVLAVSSGFVNEVLVRFGFFKVFRCDAFGQYVNPGQVRQMPSHRTDTRHRRCIQQVHARQLCRLSKLETLTSNGSNVRARLIQTSSLQAQCVPVVTVVYTWSFSKRSTPKSSTIQLLGHPVSPLMSIPIL